MLKAEVAGLEPVSIPATAIVPTDIVIAQGNDQSARVSTVRRGDREVDDGAGRWCKHAQGNRRQPHAEMLLATATP